MNKNLIIAVVLGVLVVFAAIQAFQLMGLKDSLAGRSTATVSTPVQSSGGGAGAPALPSSLQDLPSMVGGC